MAAETSLDGWTIRKPSVAGSASILFVLLKSLKNFPGSRDEINPPTWKLSWWLDIYSLPPLCTSALLVPQHFQCRVWCHCPNLLKGQRTAAPSYHIFINELSEVLKAMLFCDCVWIVAIFVGHTICLQCSRACQQQSGEVFQPVSCRKVKQRWQLLIPLICEKRSLLESKLLFYQQQRQQMRKTS